MPIEMEVKLIIQFAFFCFFLSAAALVDGIVMALRGQRSGIIAG